MAIELGHLNWCAHLASTIVPRVRPTAVVAEPFIPSGDRKGHAACWVSAATCRLFVRYYYIEL